MRTFLAMLLLFIVVGAVMCLIRFPAVLFPAPINVAYGENAGYDSSKINFGDPEFSLWDLYRNNDLAKLLHMIFDLDDFITSHPNNEVTKAILAINDPEKLCETHPNNELCSTFRFITQKNGLCKDHPNNELCKALILLIVPNGYCKHHASNEACKGRALMKNPKKFCDEHKNNELCVAGGKLRNLIDKAPGALKHICPVCPDASGMPGTSPGPGPLPPGADPRPGPIRMPRPSPTSPGGSGLPF